MDTGKSGDLNPDRSASSIPPARGVAASIDEERAEQIEEMGLMLGEDRGRLAVSLDLLTEALVVAGTHAVYCRLPGRPEAQAPNRDMKTIMSRIEHAKSLVQDVMTSLARRK
jgi:hypothetical protein